jgi:hypothetical protein
MTRYLLIGKKEEETAIEEWGDNGRGIKKTDRALGTFFSLSFFLRFFTA